MPLPSIGLVSYDIIGNVITVNNEQLAKIDNFLYQTTYYDIITYGTFVQAEINQTGPLTLTYVNIVNNTDFIIKNGVIFRKIIN